MKKESKHTTLWKMRQQKTATELTLLLVYEGKYGFLFILNEKEYFLLKY